MCLDLNAIRDCSLLSMVLIALGGYTPMSYAIEQDCQITTDVSHIDYGQLTYNNEVRNGKLMLGPRDVRVTATCSRVSSFSLYFDGRKGESRGFEFGPLGSIRVKVSSASVDGKSVALSRINKDEQGRDNVIVDADEGVTPKNGSMEEVGKVFSVTVSVAPRLDTRALSVRDETLIENLVGLRLESRPLARN